MNTECDNNSELLEKAVKEAQQARQHQCAVLIDCMKGSASIKEHLEAIITGDLFSAWESRKERPTLYFEDEQLDEVVSFLFATIRETPRARQQDDWVDVVMDVLLPEVLHYFFLYFLHYIGRPERHQAGRGTIVMKVRTKQTQIQILKHTQTHLIMPVAWMYTY